MGAEAHGNQASTRQASPQRTCADATAQSSVAFVSAYVGVWGTAPGKSAQLNAEIPVSARPMVRVWISAVPS